MRYFNPVGAHPSALIGELPRGVPNNLVPFITQTAIGKRECLSVFGNDYHTPDGTCQTDFIDIVDLAKAHASGCRMLDGKMKKEYEIFNIVWGKPLSVMELINAFEKANNLKLNYKFVLAGPETLPRLGRILRLPTTSWLESGEVNRGHAGRGLGLGEASGREISPWRITFRIRF